MEPLDEWPNRCPYCKRIHMALFTNTLEQVLKTSFPKYRMSLIASDDRNVMFICKDCPTEILVPTIQYLGVSDSTYLNAVVRGHLERHSAICDGTNKVTVKASKVQPISPDRKIVLE